MTASRHTSTPSHDGDDLFDRLKAASREAWQAYTDHPFLRQLATGSLPPQAFRHYLIQDYLFLIHFARAYGLAAYKATELEDIRQAAAGLSAIVDVEMSLHVSFCAEWGLDETAMAATEEDDATLAYTRYVLEKGLQGDLLDLHVALAPCMLGYAEIGQRLAEDPRTDMDRNPYRAWIAMYASREFQDAALSERKILERLMTSRAGPGRMDSLVRTFREATRLEASFWQMGLDAAHNHS